jgi:O-succinylhomoserine sulfhydrylase
MKNPDAAKSWRARTRAVRGATRRTPFQETSEGLFLTSGYAYDSAEQAWARFKGEDPGFQYSRFGNPTVSMFEERMCLLEGAEAARATASGMAAVTASLLCFLRAGDHVVSARALFGSCRYVVEEVLSRLGIASTLIDGRDLAAWRAAVRPNTRAFFLETPSNPTLEIIDLKGVAQIAREVKARLVVDNVFASPILQRPMESGADIVVYSATKHIDGQGRCLGGVILCDEAFIRDHLQMFVRNTGPTLSPFNAWVLLKSLETLELRMGEHCRNAAVIADFLAEQNKVTRVLYPGRRDHPQHGLAMKQMSQGGSMVTFEIAGGRTEAFRFANALRIIDISNNLGDAKSLVTHPATTTHWRIGADARAELGISDAMLRLSVGLEDVEDLKEDLTQALAAI